MDILIGADPEFFLKDKETGKFVSAYGMIEGTKKNPLKVDGGAVQVDGMALEFNIDPARSRKEFSGNITKVLAQLRAMIPDKYEFVFTPVAHFGEEYIQSQPPEAKVLGCDPDFNAYRDGAPNPTPDGSLGFRTASGHIHIGWTNDVSITDPEHLDACHMLIKQLETVLGTSSLAWDDDTTRRELYGKAGSYRPKPYGVEYRTLSNAWLRSPNLIDYVYNTAYWAVSELLEGRQHYVSYYAGGVENTINTNKVSRAYEIVNRLGLYDENVFTLFSMRIRQANILAGGDTYMAATTGTNTFMDFGNA